MGGASRPEILESRKALKKLLRDRCFPLTCEPDSKSSDARHPGQQGLDILNLVRKQKKPQDNRCVKSIRLE